MEAKIEYSAIKPIFTNYKDYQEIALLEVNRLGITDTKDLVLQSINLISTIYETVKDGFQFKDVLVVPTLISKIMSITSLIEPAKAEIKDLKNDEAKILGELAISSFLSSFKITIGKGNAYGIDNIATTLEKLFKVIKQVKQALADGLDFTDIAVLPGVITLIIQILLNAKNIGNEFNDLNNSEVATLSGLVVLYIYGLIAE